jgi:DNA-binding response OmpR family regulator
MNKILLIDDEKIYADPLMFSAKENHLDIHWETTGYDGLDYLSKNHKNINLLILDMVLPDMAGTEIQKEVLRKYPDMPIVIVTTRRLSEINESVGLELGAEEYYDKNRGINILIIKIMQILERHKSASSDHNKVKNSHVLSYNEITEQFSVDEQLLDLRRSQKKILLKLYKNPNRILPEEQLRQDAGLAATAEIRGYISSIRSLLADAGVEEPKKLIKTEVRLGYRYIP